MAALASFAGVLLAALLAVVGIGQAFAQDSGVGTATAEAPNSADSSTPSATVAIRSAQIRTLSQSDLSILTGNVQRPNGIVWFNGKLYTSCTGDWTLYQLDSASGETITYIYGVRNAHTLYAENDPNGELTLWVPDFQSNAVVRVTRNGVRPVVNNMKGPWGIAALDDDQFLVTNLLGNTVDQIGRDGKQQSIISDLASPTGIVTDGKTIYVANNGSTRRSVEWYSADSKSRTTEDNHLLVGGLQNVTDLALGPDGFLYMAYSIGTRGVVGRVDPGACKDGGCTRDDVQVVVLTELAAPLAGLTISPDMRLFVHTMFSPDIYWAQLENSPDD